MLDSSLSQASCKSNLQVSRLLAIIYVSWMTANLCEYTAFNRKNQPLRTSKSCDLDTNSNEILTVY